MLRGAANNLHMSKSESTKKYTYLSWANDKIQEAKGPGNVLSISPEMVHFCDGNHKYAAFFTHLLFWSAHSETGWVYKTWKDWFREAGLVQADVDSATKHFLARNLLSKKVKKAKNGSPTVHYQIDGKGFETAFTAYLEYRKSMNWESQKSRLRFEKFSAMDFKKSAKTSNRTDNKTNTKTNTQTPPIPPQGARGSRKAVRPPMQDPMCIKLAQVCKLDPQVNERKIRSLAHKFRLAGYTPKHINKLERAVWNAMPDCFAGNITPSMAERYIWDTLTEDEQESVRKCTLYAIVAGKPEERIWNAPGKDVMAYCQNCGTPISTYALSPDKNATRLFCSKECLQSAE